MISGINVPEASMYASLSNRRHFPTLRAPQSQSVTSQPASLPIFEGSCFTGLALTTLTVLQYVAYDFMMQRTQLVTTYLTYASTESHEKWFIFRNYLHDSSHLEGPTHNT